MTRFATTFGVLALSACLSSQAMAAENLQPLLNFYSPIGVYNGTVVHTVPADYTLVGVRIGLGVDGILHITMNKSYQADTPYGPAQAAPGMGQWIFLPDGRIKAVFQQDIQAAPGNAANGAPLFSETLTWIATFNAKTGALGGNWTGKVYDPAGTFLFDVAGTLNVQHIPAISAN